MTDKASDARDAIGRAVALQAAGKTDEAEAIFRSVLDDAPDHPDALHLLGLLEFQKGRVDEAAGLIARAVERKPRNPTYAENLGRILADAGRWAEAADVLGKAVAIDGGVARAHFLLGECLYRLDRPGEAEPCYRRALALMPDHQGAGNSLGVMLEQQGRTEEAEAVYRQTLAAAGEAPDLLFNLGNVLRDQHRADDAIAAYRRAIALKPDFAEAHVHLAFALMLRGDYAPAWPEYEWRWRVPAFGGGKRQFPAPAWDGGRLEGRTLLLWAEQGFGDTLQFARYAGVAAKLGGKVILECQPALARLMASADGVGKSIAYGDTLPEVDLQAPLLSVPGLLGTTLKTVPANVPYVAAPPNELAKWRKRLKGPGLKVGIAWRGTAERRGNPARACPLSAFAPLYENPAIRVFSLQKQVPADDRPLPAGVADLSGDIGDFADTAAIIGALDAVVSIDTAVAHLAGALGAPTKLALSTAGDWRWLTERDSSPWYPSVRIYRQAGPGDWAGVLVRIARDAARMAAAGPKPKARKTAKKRPAAGAKSGPKRRRKRT